MAWVAFFVFLGKLAGAAKEMAIAWRYGVSDEVDAYLFIFNLINWPVAVWFSVLTIVLLPLVARIRQEASSELPRFRAELLGLALLLGLVLALLAWFGLPLLIRSPLAGLSSTATAAAVDMVPRLALLGPLGILISLFSAWMLANGRHANTLLESVPALAILAALLILPGDHAEPLVWGTLAGFVLHSAGLAFPLARSREIEAPLFTHQSPQWNFFWQGFGVMLAGQALMSFTGIIDQFFAARIGSGAIATLSYANRVLALILALGATAVSRATLPVFSRAQALGGGQTHHVAVRWVRILFALGMAAMIVGWWMAPWGVKLLFERGAFSAQQTEAVTEVLRYGMAQLPFYFPSIVLVSLLASQGKHRAIAAVAGANLLIKLLAMIILVPILKLKGIVLATSLMYAITLLLLGFVGRKAKK